MTLSEYIKNNDVELTEEQEQKLNELLGVKKNKTWKPEQDEIYYYITFYGNIASDYWQDSSYDERSFELNNIFKTKEEAEFEIEKKKLLIELKCFADENNAEIDWGDEDQDKYHMIYDYDDAVFRYSYSTFARDILAIYFTSEALVQHAIDKFGDRMKKYLIFPEQSK